MSKYNNKITYIDGIKFDSLAEYDRYLELKCLECAGEINSLKLQPRFDFIMPINGWDSIIPTKKIFTYKADFSYYKKDKVSPTIEDVKGFETAVFKLKKKLIEALYNIKIELIK